MAIKVLVVDGQRLVSQALAVALDGYEDLDVVEDQPITGAETLEAAVTCRPDVVVLDCWLPDVQGPGVVRLVRARLADCKVVMMSGFYSPQHIDDALLAGAAGFLPKTIGLDELADAIRQAHAGTYPVDRERLSKLRGGLDRWVKIADDLEERFASLSPREVEVLTLLNHGRSTDEIACELDISPKTVAHHAQAILDKTGTKSRTEALSLARNIGFIPPVPSGWVSD